jgi:hypothetical protein
MQQLFEVRPPSCSLSCVSTVQRTRRRSRSSVSVGGWLSVVVTVIVPVGARPAWPPPPPRVAALPPRRLRCTWSDIACAEKRAAARSPRVAVAGGVAGGDPGAAGGACVSYFAPRWRWRLVFVSAPKCGKHSTLALAPPHLRSRRRWRQRRGNVRLAASSSGEYIPVVTDFALDGVSGRGS